MFSRVERYRSYEAGAFCPGPFRSRRTPLQFLARSFLVLGALSLAAWAAHAAHARFRQESLDQRLTELLAASPSGEAPVAPSPEDPIGRIEIAGRDVSSPILRGVDRAVLDVAVGQIPGTSDLHQHGNVGLAGHRDTHFRGLRDVRMGDRITIETTEGTLAYEVRWTKVTTPEDVEVIAPQTEDVLTLVTCFPFHYVGSAPNRFIVRAARIAPEDGTTPARLPDLPAP